MNKSIPLSEIPAFRFVSGQPERPVLLGDDAQAFIAQKFNGGYNFGTDELARHGTFKLAGWQFDFRACLNHYLYRVGETNEWREGYAPTKQGLRKALSLFSRNDVLSFPKH